MTKPKIHLIISYRDLQYCNYSKDSLFNPNAHIDWNIIGLMNYATENN